jgi:hypothetical protein
MNGMGRLLAAFGFGQENQQRRDDQDEPRRLRPPLPFAAIFNAKPSFHPDPTAC